jgi:hypothetical protein
MRRTASPDVVRAGRQHRPNSPAPSLPRGHPSAPSILDRTSMASPAPPMMQAAEPIHIPRPFAWQVSGPSPNMLKHLSAPPANICLVPCSSKRPVPLTPDIPSPHPLCSPPRSVKPVSGSQTLVCCSWHVMSQHPCWTNHYATASYWRRWRRV